MVRLRVHRVRRAAAFVVRLWLGAAMFLRATPSHAQIAAPNPDTERARMQIGPLGLTPSIALTNFGVDTNVFNEFEDAKQDVTFTVAPQLDAFFRMRRLRVNVAARSNMVYFQQYASERSLDGAVAARIELRGPRLTPWVAPSIESGRQRFGYEIDLRFRRVTTDVAAGIDARVSARTQLVLSARHARYDHAGDSVFLGSSLKEALNRDSDTLAIDLKYHVTPLTTFVASAQTVRDRFEFRHDRDTDSVRVDAGFDLTPYALISGRGRIGYRTLNGRDVTIRDFSGLVASVAAGSTIKGRTRIDVFGDRDVSYSYEFAYPYFVLSGAMVTVTPRLTQRWDTQARGGLHRLAYREIPGVADLLHDRVDRYGIVGAGIGYHLGRDTRIGVNIDRERRSSPVQRRAYMGYRTGISVTYGR